ncbi:MAG: PHP domain-containing protein [Chloroflexi bacterium]|nr:PHP domain-containing protein [Chloroflexota bacterium]
MLIDLHVHTFKSGDSSLSPEELAHEAKRIGLDGVCLTEHGGGWGRDEFERFARQHNLLLVRALEVDTDVGHIAVFGVDGYVPGMSKAEGLRRIVDAAGGFAVLTHPFRRLFDQPSGRNFLYPGPLHRLPTAEEAAQHPIFNLVDDVEVLNGGNTERENCFAREVADLRGMKGTGGSDAHSTHGLGCFVTYFEKTIRSTAELVEELRARRFTPVHGLLQGQPRPFSGNGRLAFRS